MKNKMAICEWCFPICGPSSVTLASEIGFDGIQLSDLGGVAKRYPMNERRIQEAYMEAAEKTHVELQTLHLHALTREGTMLFPMKSKEGQSAILSIKKGVEACEAMRIPTLFLASFFASLIRNDYEFYNFSAMLKFACQYGKDHGIRIVYESVLPIRRFLHMREVVGEELKILYDTLNPLTYGTGNPSEEIRAFGKEAIDQIHVKDRTSDFKSGCLLGEGVGRIMETAKTIKDIGWTGWIVNETYFFEFPYVEGQSALWLMKRDLDNMRRIFGE